MVVPEGIKNNDDNAINWLFGPTTLVLNMNMGRTFDLFFFISIEKGRRRWWKAGRMVDIRALAVMWKLSASEKKASSE